MITTRGSGWTLVIAVSAMSLGCNFTSVQHAKSEIQAKYDIQSNGYVTKNPSAIFAVCSKDYMEVNGRRTDNLATAGKSISEFIYMADKMEATATVREVSVTDDAAQVTVDRHFDLLTLLIRRKGQSHFVQHRFISDETNHEVWVRDARQGWLKYKSMTVASRSTVDGKQY